MDRKEKIDKLKEINTANGKLNPFKMGINEFHDYIANMNWNELRKLATSANISVKERRKEDIKRDICKHYVSLGRRKR